MKTTILLRAATATLATAYLMACQPSLMNEGLPSPSKSGRESAGFLTDPRVAYGSSMEVETYTYRIVESYGNSASKAMTQVNAAPRLHRERIESRVLEDGSMEMNTEQLRPQQLAKLPTDQRKWQKLGPHRTELGSGRAIFYDHGGRQISQRVLKAVSFAAQIQEARKAKGLSRDEPLKAIPPTGYPKVDTATIQKAIGESPGGTRRLGKHVVQLRQEKPTQNECMNYVQKQVTTYYVDNSDGVVPAFSARNDGGTWRGHTVEAPHTNHRELLVYDKIKDTFDPIFGGSNTGSQSIFEIGR